MRLIKIRPYRRANTATPVRAKVVVKSLCSIPSAKLVKGITQPGLDNAMSSFGQARLVANLGV